MTAPTVAGRGSAAAVRAAARTSVRLVALLSTAAVLCFTLLQIAPADPVSAYLGEGSTAGEAQRRELTEKWGLDDPLPLQLLTWAGHVLRGDFGTSFLYQRPVTAVIGDALANSLLLTTSAWLLSGLLGVAVGTTCAVWRDRWPDRVLRGLAYVTASTPTFWVGMVILLVFSVRLGWFPVGFSTPIGSDGSSVRLVDRLHHMVLPCAALALTGVSTIALQTRARLVDVLEQDYCRLAQTRGASRLQIVRRHGLRNSMLAIVTVQFGSVNELLGGTVLVENVFSYAGLGSLTTSSALGGDLPLFLAIVLLSALFVFTGNLIADLTYPFIDPRIRTQGDH